MPARGVKRTASKTASAASTAPKSKKKRGVTQLEIPQAPKKRGFVLTCGQGDVGQLGLGEDVIETTKFKKVTALGDKIVAASAGGMHNIALDSTGKVWTYGCNDEGALGRTTNGDKDEATPKKVTLPGKAVMVTAGDSHSSALLENGDVYAWGSFRDSHGSMGLMVSGRTGCVCRAPARVPLPEPCAALASGGDHLAALTVSGSVYTMGCGEQGQLGRLSQRSASRDARQGFSALLVPSKVSLKGGASRVWAGYHATFVLDAAQEKVFAFGLNNYGQLGITGEKRRGAIYGPTQCDAFTHGAWRHIACGQHHSLALSDDGKVYAVGRCEYGRLGLGEGTGDADTLTAVPLLSDKRCVSISAGTSSSFAVTDSGEVFSWGMGSEGQLGTGNTEDASVPTPAHVAVGRATHVSAGGQHTLLTAEDPNQKDLSPDPESEEEEQAEETQQKTEGKRTRKKKEQEGEVTSTSEPVPTESRPKKINGDDKDMEVDETDNTQEKKDEKQDSPQKMDTDQDSGQKQDSEEKTAETHSELKTQDDSQDSVKTQDSEKSQDSQKSQDSEKSVDSQKSQDSEKSQDSIKSQDSKSQDSQDVDMKAEVNGTEEKVPSKSVELLPQSNQLTTTA